MKQMLSKFIVVCLATIVLSFCSGIIPDGASFLNSTTVFSAFADPIHAAPEPLQIFPPIQDSPIQQPLKLAVQAGQKHLSPLPSYEQLVHTIPLETARPQGTLAFDESLNNGQELSSDSAPLVYDKTLLTEDTTWRGTVIVKGYVVVAPQATLRIEAGTVVRFAGTSDRQDAARLVVQGRIQATGTAERPIVLTSDRPKPARGDWGGISLVASEKRNILEQCRIEYASTGIEVVFSTLNLKDVTITNAPVGLLMRDSVVQMAGGGVTESETGFEIHDSELEVLEATVSGCQSGLTMYRSAVSISAARISNNKLVGILSEECRIKITSGEVSGNGAGARFKGGEGQILGSFFSGNRLTALQLSGSRIKLQRCYFIDNVQDALRLEDGRALVAGNAFSGNKGFNLYNAGRESVVALQNWWGSAERSTILQKIHDAARDPRSGTVQLFPWLSEKPRQLP